MTEMRGPDGSNILAFVASKPLGHKLKQAADALPSATMTFFDKMASLRAALAADRQAPLLLEWIEPASVRVLDLSRGEQRYDQRPIYLVAASAHGKFLNIVAEYHVTMIRYGDLSAGDILTDLRQLIDSRSPLRQPSEILAAYSRLLAGGQLAEALSLCEKMIASRPKNLRYRLEKAFVQGELGRWKDAEATVNEILAIDRNLAQVLQLKSRCLKARGLLAPAATYLARASQLNPYGLGRHLDLGDIYLELFKPQDATMAYTRARANSRSSKRALVGLASASLLGEQDEAGTRLLAELPSDIDKASAFNRAGVNAVKHKRFETADRLYAKAEAVLRDPKVLSRIVYNRALAAIKAGRKTHGVNHLRRAVQLDPENDKARDLLTRMEHKKRQAEQASA